MAISVPSKSLILLGCVSLLAVTGLVVCFMSMSEDPVMIEEGGLVLPDTGKRVTAEVLEARPLGDISLPVASEELTHQVVEVSDAQQAIAPSPGEQSQPIADDEKPAEVGPFAESPAMRAEQTFKMDLPMREIGRAWLDDQGRDNFSMPVTGERDLAIEVEQFEALGRDGGQFVGSVKGAPGSSVELSYRGQAEAGTIRLPSENRIYRIYPGQDGAVVVQEFDLAMDERSTAVEPLFNAELPPVPNFTPPPPPNNLLESTTESKD
jgi:hypothetical protein